MKLEEQALIDFVDQWGHPMVPKSYVAHIDDDQVFLGEWVRTQREKYKSGTLVKDAVDFLESVDHWEWDPTNSPNSEKLLMTEALLQFSLRENNAYIPFNHIEMVDDEPVKLGEWVQHNVKPLKPWICATPFIKDQMYKNDYYEYLNGNWLNHMSEEDRASLYDAFFDPARSEGLEPPTF